MTRPHLPSPRPHAAEAGRSRLESQSDHADAPLARLAYIGKPRRQMNEATNGGDPPDESGDLDSPDAFVGRGRCAEGPPPVPAARRSPSSTLTEKPGATAIEQRCIAETLARAASVICNGTAG